MVCYDTHIFDIETLFKAYVIHMPHLYILKGNAMFYLVKWNLYIAYVKAMLLGFLCPKIKIVSA